MELLTKEAIMECKAIQERIDLLVFEENEESRKEVMEHIEGCPSCRAIYDKSLQAHALITGIRNHQPVISDPEGLTKSILSNIQKSLKPVSDKSLHMPIILHLPMIEKILVAASIALLLVFGYEQYIVVNKVIHLEQKMSDAPQSQSHVRAYQKMMTGYPARVGNLIQSKSKYRIFNQKKSRYRAFLSLSVSGPGNPEPDRSGPGGSADSIPGIEDKVRKEATFKTN
jgi:hypothetical protein